MIGAIVAPLTVALFLGASGSHQDLPHTLWKLCYEILLPLIGGVLTQVVLRRSAVGRRVLGVRAWGVLMITVLLLLFYLIFCKAFGPGSEMPSPTTLLVVIGWETGVHLLLVALAWVISLPLAAPRRAMFVLSRRRRRRAWPPRCSPSCSTARLTSASASSCCQSWCTTRCR